MYAIAISLTIISNICYHFCQKSIPGDAPPMLSLAVTYLVAFFCTLLLIPVFGTQSAPVMSMQNVHWSNVVLGVSIVFLELGFLLAYRAGWNIGFAALFSNTAVAIFLIPIAIFLFKDTLNPRQVAGIFFAIVGLVLLAKK